MFFKHTDADGRVTYGECDPAHAPEGAKELSEEELNAEIDAARIAAAEATVAAVKVR